VPTKMRSLRIPDDVWENAQRVAAFYDTNVTEMIVFFLKRLHTRGIPETTATTVVRKICGVDAKQSAAAKARTQFGPAIPETEERKRKIENCTHLVIKTIPYGTFCTGCGKRMDSVSK
jgi:hypothetical protein